VSRVLIVGATSAIAEAVARRYAARGAALYLTARDETRLGAIAADLRVRGASQVGSEVLDCNRHELHAPMLERAAAALGCEASVEATLAEIATNALSVVALLTLAANRMETAGAGTLAVISSVAGDRGRASNYVYGSAKALVSTFLSGLRQRLYARGVRVVSIKPGFVSTPMTRDFRKGLLWATPAAVARGIVEAIDRGTPVAYVPAFWRYIMVVVRLAPEGLFRRLRM
jgi:short-subunit dehydrogenase